MSRFRDYDETDDMLDEEADNYYENETDSEDDDCVVETDTFDDDDEKVNHFTCQRAGTCCLGCEDCDLENECSMCEHDGNHYYCDHCIVADDY